MTTSLLAFAALGVASLVTSFISGILGMAGGMILMGCCSPSCRCPPR
jgi:hypothetical protein